MGWDKLLKKSRSSSVRVFRLLYVVKTELPLAVASDTEIHSVIRYFIMLGNIGAAIHWKIEEVYGEARIRVQIVRHWRQMFLNGRTNVDNEQRSGRQGNAIMENAMNTVCTLIEQDRRITKRQIEKFFIEDACDPISHSTICKIIHHKLEMSKVCVRWQNQL